MELTAINFKTTFYLLEYSIANTFGDTFGDTESIQ